MYKYYYHFVPGVITPSHTRDQIQKNHHAQTGGKSEFFFLKKNNNITNDSYTTQTRTLFEKKMARTKRVRLVTKQEAVSDTEGDTRIKMKKKPVASSAANGIKGRPGSNGVASSPSENGERCTSEKEPLSGKEKSEPEDKRSTYFQQTPFNRLCRSISDKICEECCYETESFRWSAEALHIVREVSETFLTELFLKAKEFSDHAEKKETVRLKDFALAVKNDAGNPFLYEDMIASKPGAGVDGDCVTRTPEKGRGDEKRKVKISKRKRTSESLEANNKMTKS